MTPHDERQRALRKVIEAAWDSGRIDGELLNSFDSVVAIPSDEYARLRRALWLLMQWCYPDHVPGPLANAISDALVLVCSYCNREVHQDGPDHSWRHCDDKTPRCIGATSRYPASEKEIVGKWCGSDDFDGVFRKRGGRGC